MLIFAAFLFNIVNSLQFVQKKYNYFKIFIEI